MVRYGKVKIFLWANLALFYHDGGSKCKKIRVVFVSKLLFSVFGSLQIFWWVVFLLIFVSPQKGSSTQSAGVSGQPLNEGVGGQ